MRNTNSKNDLVTRFVTVLSEHVDKLIVLFDQCLTNIGRDAAAANPDLVKKVGVLLIEGP